MPKAEKTELHKTLGFNTKLAHR